MEHISISRKLPVGVTEAFSWLTDYTPDDSAIFGDPPGGRQVTRIAENRFRLVNRYPGSRMVEETEVTLQPPARWSGEGTLHYRGFRIATYKQQLELNPSESGSLLKMNVDVNVTSLLVRLYLFLRPGYISREIESHYDRIRQRMLSEISPGKETRETAVGSPAR